MLKLIIKGKELYDEATNQFSTEGDVAIELEHSLVSMSKWESKHMKPFLAPGEKTPEELLDYVSIMILTPDFPPEVLAMMTQENVDEINDYINSAQTATTFGELPKQKGKGETITAELIYYWMVAYNIPFDVEHWHLNRLFALVRICNLKNSKPKKMSKSELAQRNRELNEKRRAQYNTKG